MDGATNEYLTENPFRSTNEFEFDKKESLSKKNVKSSNDTKIVPYSYLWNLDVGHDMGSIWNKENNKIFFLLLEKVRIVPR